MRSVVTGLESLSSKMVEILQNLKVLENQKEENRAEFEAHTNRALESDTKNQTVHFATNEDGKFLAVTRVNSFNKIPTEMVPDLKKVFAEKFDKLFVTEKKVTLKESKKEALFNMIADLGMDASEFFDISAETKMSPDFREKSKACFSDVQKETVSILLDSFSQKMRMSVK